MLEVSDVMGWKLPKLEWLPAAAAAAAGVDMGGKPGKLPNMDMLGGGAAAAAAAW